MFSKIPLTVFVVVLAIMSVSSPFMHRMTHTVSISFHLLAIAWGIMTTVRGFQERKALCARASSLQAVPPKPMRAEGH